jgi:demethylmenaquinone methyltransferase/2-methoxy-6-polyprenyl-1,4-benzoquinol methylase
MFADVASRYDLLNHLLSFNIDKSWRRRLRRSVEEGLSLPETRVLDLCCGTGDVLLDLQNRSRSVTFGADFCHPMLIEARRKIAKSKRPSQVFEGDALKLPLRDAFLDVITIAFGFRNLANYDAGLEEFARVLKPGGRLSILEFSHPRNAVVATGYGIYSKWLLPILGGAISGSREAYTYLPESIRKFPRAELLAEMMRHHGFGNARYELLTGGIAALHWGDRE